MFETLFNQLHIQKHFKISNNNNSIEFDILNMSDYIVSTIICVYIKQYKYSRKTINILNCDSTYKNYH